MRAVALRGLAAGSLAAAIFAAWFLLVDLIKGQPLATPAYMSGVVFSFTTALPATARLAAFTVLHFAAFGATGVLIAWVLDKIELKPHTYFGLPLGFLLFDLVFYASIIFLGVDIVRALGWPQVLIGNVLAGLVLMGYLRVKSGEPVETFRELLARRATLRRGVVAGVIGASVVALWFLVIDALNDHVFYTPAALGSALLLGASEPADVVTSAEIIIGYTLVHGAAFVLFGLFAAWMMEKAEQFPPLLLGLILVFVTLEVLSLGVLIALATWLFETIPSWSPIVANLLAAAAMLGYLWRQHPALRHHIGEPLEEEAVR
ncbi:MAG: hypothetical protein ACT443_12540 [Gemmatimonadota bacterium]